MARSNFSARRIPNGTYGSYWLNDERMAEVYGCQAKVQVNTETINQCGQFMEDYKPISGKGTGSLMLYKVDSGMIEYMRTVQDGQIPVGKIVTKVADPDSAGFERIAYYGVMFTDLTLADWEAAKISRITAPFTFTRWEPLDLIEVQ